MDRAVCSSGRQQIGPTAQAVPTDMTLQVPVAALVRLPVNGRATGSLTTQPWAVTGWLPAACMQLRLGMVCSCSSSHLNGTCLPHAAAATPPSACYFFCAALHCLALW